MPPRKSYTVSKKLQIVRRIEAGEKLEKISRELQIDRRCLQRWRKGKAHLLEVATQSNGGKKRYIRNIKTYARYPDLERKLVLWIKETRERRITVSKSDITENAKRLFTELQLNGDFTASSGWVRKFLKRNKLSNRRVTGHAQKIPDNAAVQCMAFIDQAHSIIREKGIDPQNVINMDETPLYFDMASATTYDQTGTKDVLIKTTGYEKLRFTVVLSITASGKRLEPMLIFKNLKDVPKLKNGEKWPAGVHITVAKGGSMTTELFITYLEKIIKKRSGAIFMPPTVVIMDRAASHRVNEVVKLHNSDALLIPGGCTSLIQPLDVTINKPFKDRMRIKWRNWLDIPADQQLLTKKGNRQRASYLSVAQWVKEAWEEIPSDMIRASFTSSGLLPMTDWQAKLHNRLKAILTPDEPIAVDSSDEEEEVLEEAQGFMTDIETDNDSCDDDSDEWTMEASRPTGACAEASTSANSLKFILSKVSTSTVVATPLPPITDTPEVAEVVSGADAPVGSETDVTDAAAGNGHRPLSSRDAYYYQLLLNAIDSEGDCNEELEEFDDMAASDYSD